MCGFNLEKLNAMHIDVLKEIGNIGSGNAATALSCLLSDTVDMSVPDVKVVDINQALTLLGGPENLVYGVMGRITGDIHAYMMFLIQQEFAAVILQEMLEKKITSFQELTELDLSAIAEIGNILISSYVNSITTLSQLDMKLSVPALCVDMVGAMLSVPAIEMGAVSDQLIFIKNDFLSEVHTITANMLLVPDMDSLKKIMQRLGIEL